MNNSSKNPPSKHPREMTTHEAVNHLFHPEILQHIQKKALQVEPKQKPPTTKE